MLLPATAFRVRGGDIVVDSRNSRLKFLVCFVFGGRAVRNLVMLSVLVLVSTITACVGVDGYDGRSKSAIAVFGDMPYDLTPTATDQFNLHPRFINSINLDPDVSLVLHVGDIHSGRQYCTEAYNRAIYTHWTTFRSPLVYIPGDNEWADCHKVAQGGGTYNETTKTINYVVDASGKQVSHAGGNPVANLDLVRSIFFAYPGKTLGGSMNVHTQAREFDPAYPSDRNYVEHMWWKKSGVLFVTLNIPGSSNNDTDPWYGVPAMSPEQVQEVNQRTGAVLRWIDMAFKQARLDGAMAVLIQLQADMWDLDSNVASHLAQYKQFIDKIASNTKAFGKPVLLISGDSHVFRVDNPLMQGAPCVIEPKPGAEAIVCAGHIMPAKNPADPYLTQPHGYDVPNFRRLVVHGSLVPLEWLKLTIDPGGNASSAHAFGPFSWQRMRPVLQP